MKKDKVAGSDGLSREFYLTFWKELKVPLYQMYLEVLNSGKLGKTARNGLISLIPKKNKDTRVLKNLRPLTLLNLDYKILAKLYADRLKKFLPSIISDHQTGFMSGRQIHTNLRKSIDIISHIYQSGKRAVVVSIDFEKCLDRLEHQAIKGSMHYFGFGNKFINAVMIFLIFGSARKMQGIFLHRF